MLFLYKNCYIAALLILKTMKKVKTKKQLESQGIARIESNDFWQFGGEGEYKYVLNIIKVGVFFKDERTSNFPHKTIKSCIDHYNRGFIDLNGTTF